MNISDSIPLVRMALALLEGYSSPSEQGSDSDSDSDSDDGIVVTIDRRVGWVNLQSEYKCCPGLVRTEASSCQEASSFLQNPAQGGQEGKEGGEGGGETTGRQLLLVLLLTSCSYSC